MSGGMSGDSPTFTTLVGSIQTIPITAAIIKAGALTKANIIVLPTTLVFFRISIYSIRE